MSYESGAQVVPEERGEGDLGVERGPGEVDRVGVGSEERRGGEPSVKEAAQGNYANKHLL